MRIRDTPNTFRWECAQGYTKHIQVRVASGTHQTLLGESLHQGHNHFQVRVCIRDTITFRWEFASGTHQTHSGESVHRDTPNTFRWECASGTHQTHSGESVHRDTPNTFKWELHQVHNKHFQVRVCIRGTITFRWEFASGAQSLSGESLHQGHNHFQVRVCIRDTPNTFRCRHVLKIIIIVLFRWRCTPWYCLGGGVLPDAV